MADKPVLEPRYHVELEYTGTDPVILKAKGYKPETLKPGLNKIMIGLYHALGGSEVIQDLIGKGLLTPTCTQHKFETMEDGVTPHEDKIHCRYCGHTRESAIEAARQREHDATPEGKAKLDAAKAERAEALAHHEACVKLAREGKHKEAQELAVGYSKAKEKNQAKPVDLE